MYFNCRVSNQAHKVYFLYIFTLAIVSKLLLQNDQSIAQNEFFSDFSQLSIPCFNFDMISAQIKTH